MIFCPMTLSGRRVSNCEFCEHMITIDEDSVLCDYYYPDKEWFWKRQLNLDYPKKIKVKK